MSTFNIVRAWKDAEYRKSLSIDEKRLLPEHPAGTVELTEAELGMAAAGAAAGTNLDCTAGCCCKVFTCCCTQTGD